MVALGFIVGTQLAARRAGKAGLSAAAMNDAGLLCLIFGILGAHVVALLGAEPEVLWKAPWRLLQFWSGLSSFGGFFGAGIAVAVFFRRKKLPFLPYADALMFGLFPGWILGRLGCFNAHDHPGRLTDFFLAVRYPGGTRHDLGLYEAIVAVVVSGIIYYLGKKPRPVGFIFAATILLYTPVRFLLDFLRATDLSGSDPHYFGWTPVQFGSIPLFIWGVYLFARVRNNAPTWGS
jgi:phosphatidylglycerol---prolipoprotein diacylglyceryl transferase